MQQDQSKTAKQWTSEHHVVRLLTKQLVEQIQFDARAGLLAKLAQQEKELVELKKILTIISPLKFRRLAAWTGTEVQDDLHRLANAIDSAMQPKGNKV